MMVILYGNHSPRDFLKHQQVHSSHCSTRISINKQIKGNVWGEGGREGGREGGGREGGREGGRASLLPAQAVEELHHTSL